MKFWRVDCIESERGWGQKLDERKYFREDEKAKADAFVTEYNKDNPRGYVPDWYMQAESPELVTVDDALAKLIVEALKVKPKRKASPKKTK